MEDNDFKMLKTGKPLDKLKVSKMDSTSYYALNKNTVILTKYSLIILFCFI